MKIIASADELRHQLAGLRTEQIALVPTMGCLHEGHLSLIRNAKRLADIVVVSIYVNPLQFAADEDLDSYPQPFRQDVALCEQEGVDFIFNPTSLYPAQGIQVGLQVNDLSHRLCGISRTNHFDGVVTVVNILFNIVRPDIVIFGEKDFQQLTIIRRMVADLHMPIDIISGETVRESDGLAKSSRNRYLNSEQRQQASKLSCALQLMQDKAKHENDYANIMAAGLEYLKLQHIDIDYLEICDEYNLQAVSTTKHDAPLRIFIAATIGPARLIDNKPLLSPTLEDKQPCV